MEDNDRIVQIEFPDDRIINCCLQKIQKSLPIILLTNDINLFIKSSVNGIQAMSPKKYLDEFGPPLHSH